jgi:hypothetical protein
MRKKTPGVYEKKLKEDLFRKIEQIQDLYGRIDDKIAENPDKDIEALTDTDQEVRDLFNRVNRLEDEVQFTLVDTKYYPLCGLSEQNIADLTSPCLSEPDYLPEIEEIVRNKKGWTTRVIPGGRFSNEEAIEKYLDLELMKMREEVKKRIGQLQSLRLFSEIDARTKLLYRQIANCYTFGFYDACCVLCRALVEAIAKNYIEFKGLGELSGKAKERKKASIPVILKNELGCNSDIIKQYCRIGNQADKILHDKKTAATENEALSSIKALQTFLKAFPNRI